MESNAGVDSGWIQGSHAGNGGKIHRLDYESTPFALYVKMEAGC